MLFMWLFFQYQRAGRKEVNGNLVCEVFWVFSLNVILNSKDLLFIIKILIYCPIKAHLQKVCWLKALETEPLSKIVCAFFTIPWLFLLFGKSKLFLDISGNENKGYRQFKKQDFIIDSELKAQMYFWGIPHTTVLLTGS